MTIYDWLRIDEGDRDVPYADPVTGTLTIGVGHNLKNPLSSAARDQILRDDVARAYLLCETLPWYAPLNDARQGVIAMMVFNLGLGGVTKFSKMIAAIQVKDWNGAAAEMLQSIWATQVGGRAVRLATQMRTGIWPTSP